MLFDDGDDCDNYYGDDCEEDGDYYIMIVIIIILLLFGSFFLNKNSNTNIISYPNIYHIILYLLVFPSQGQ